PWRRMFGRAFWWGAAAGVVGASLLIGVLCLTGTSRIDGLALGGTDAVTWALLYAVGFVIVGVDEELRYRGDALFTLSRRLTFWPAAAALSLLFGAGHLHNVGETWLGAGNAALGGLLFALMLRRSGTLWLPIGAHAAWDWTQTYVFGVADSGVV